MSKNSVDEAMAKYLDVRMSKGKNGARERFLSYIHTTCSSDEIFDLLRRIGGLARYYIDFCNVMKNPLKGPELAWFFALASVALFGILLMAAHESLPIGGLLLLAGLVNTGNLFILVCRKAGEYKVLTAIYQEIAEIAEQERNILSKNL